MSGGALFITAVVLVALNMCVMFFVHTFQIVWKRGKHADTFWVGLYLFIMLVGMLYCYVRLILIIWE